MKKIICNFEEGTGNIFDDNGVLAGTCINGQFKEYNENQNADNTMKLVQLGVTTDEIIKLKHNELI